MPASSSLTALACRLAAIRIDMYTLQRQQVRRAGYPLRNDKGEWIGWVSTDGTVHMAGEGHAHSGWEGVTHHSAKASSKVGGLKEASAPRKPAAKSASGKTKAPAATQKVRSIPIDTIHTGLNPREYFDPAKIHELAESIRANGLLQPITVREHEGSYQLIAGERRLRAMQALGWTHVPVIVQNVDDKAARELALVENINREDMRPTETARAYKNMLDAGVLIKELAERTGKTVEHINQHLDLLKLPNHLQVLVDKGALPMGIVRDLAKLSDKGQEEAAERILRDDLGVKSARRLIRTISDRENQTTLFSEVKPVSQEARDAHAKVQDTLSKLTDMLAALDPQQMELAVQASDAPSREAERIQLMIKQLQRLQNDMEAESFRREKRSAFAAVQRHQIALETQVARLRREGAGG